MSQLPSNPATQKILNDAIKEAIGSKLRQDTEKDLQKDIAETIEEKTGMSKAEFNKRVSVRYKQETQPEKYNEYKEWFDSVFEDNESLAGVK